MKLRQQMEELIEAMLDGQILLGEALGEFEKLYIEKCLERHKRHISNTADVLGIHRNTLSKRIASYNHKKSKTMTNRRSG
jgi:DNA-binding NtrC family response regulator